MKEGKGPFAPLNTALAIDASKPTLWGDNKSTNLKAVNPVSSDRSKHIRVRHLRVREKRWSWMNSRLTG